MTAEHLCIGILFAAAIWQQRKINRILDLMSMAATVQRHLVEAWADRERTTAETLLRHEKMFTLLNAVQANDGDAARAAFADLYGRAPGATVN